MQTNLKTLSRQYANGLLTKADYRQARAELIDNAQDNDHTEPQVTVPQSSIDDEDQDSDSTDKEGRLGNSPRPPPEVVDDQLVKDQDQPSNKCKQRNQLLLVLVVLLGAAVGYLALA